MSLGRNPRKKSLKQRRNPRDLAAWPEVFGVNGFAGKVAANYKGKASERKPSLEDIQNRIKANGTSLAYMYLNGIYGTKTTTKERKQGKISASEMSDLQFRGSEEGVSKDEATAQNMDVLYEQLASTIIESAVYSFLMPFFTMPKDDVQAVLDAIRIEGKFNPAEIGKIKIDLEAKIRKTIGDRLSDLSFKKLVLG
jgi:hypothetical protein